MSGLYKKAGGTFILKFFGLGIAFIFQIVLGRILNPELYGEYTMYLTYSTVFSIITILGMDRNLIKEVARFEGDVTKEKSLLRFSTQTSLLITIAVAGILFLLRRFIGFSNYGLLLLISMIVIRSMIAILDGYLQGKGNVVQVTLLNSVINNILKMIFFVILILLNVDSLRAALFSFVLSEIITIFLRTAQISNRLQIKANSKLNLSLEEKRAFIKYSLTVALISGIGLMLQNIDKIMISTFLDLNRVGIYKVAQNYVNLISVFVTPFIAFWPVISKLYNENNIGQIETEMKRIVRIVTYLVVPMFFIFLFLGNDLLAIFGEAYVTKEAKLALIILAFSFLIDAISGPIGSILTMTKYAKLALYNNIASLLINITLNFILISRFGIVGVAIATGISIIVNNLISIIQVKLLLGIFSYDYRNLIQILSMGVVNYLLGMILIDAITFENIYIQIIIFGIAMYSLNLFALAVNHRKNIRNILDRRT
ncbi:MULTISPECIES: flippase [unclassified Fusibacter]|uniref:flippase n=1 Tax=unclassified Fusibacter TaxID=2624464 RepID=UPI0010119D8D|nr:MULTISPECIES: flippase [unclassified Fusibacter]MCK8061261.1 flippase [Fusibacter sp. A2]NPE23395.1 flippase [Fusibacter sp. A1]RXV59176.1 flippase [Fusibacter sp. A1]